MSSSTSARPVALVTGATAGLGLEFARQLAARDHDLVLVARNTDRLKEVARELSAKGARCEVLTADLADRAQLAKVEDRCALGLDLLVNNAGFGLKGRFLDNPVEDEQAMLDVLVTAVMRLSHAALRPMVERGSGGLINVASVAAFLPRGSYGAAKAWGVQWGKWAATEYGPRGITITTLCPGFVATEFHERLGSEEGSGFLWMSADKVVAAALADFDKGRALSIPGAQYKTMVALLRGVPSPVLQRFQGLGRK